MPYTPCSERMAFADTGAAVDLGLRGWQPFHSCPLAIPIRDCSVSSTNLVPTCFFLRSRSRLFYLFPRFSFGRASSPVPDSSSPALFLNPALYDYPVSLTH
eukprot:949873-Pleurochrysis_carterae.AAC.1